MSKFTESALEYLASLAWPNVFSPTITPGEPVLRDALLPRLMSGEVMVIA